MWKNKQGRCGYSLNVPPDTVLCPSLLFPPISLFLWLNHSNPDTLTQGCMSFVKVGFQIMGSSAGLTVVSPIWYF